MTNTDADIAAMTYEQARDELVDVVRRLETGAATLEDSLTLWERGEALADRCQRWLDSARERLAAAKGDSVVTTEDATTEEPGVDEPATDEPTDA